MDTRGDGWNSPVCGDWGDEECTGEVEVSEAKGVGNKLREIESERLFFGQRCTVTRGDYF